MAQAPEQLLEAVDRNPDSLEARRVLGDWLSEHDDPRGPLLTLQAKELTAAGPLLSAVRVMAADQLAKNADALWGPLPEASRATTHWRLGYWDAISLGPEADARAVLNHPSARFLRRLGLTGHASLICDRLPQLEQLEVNLHGAWHCVTGEVAPKLRALWLCCRGLQLEPDLPPIEELKLTALYGDPGVYSGFEAAGLMPWMQLVTLDLQSTVSAKTIENFLSPGRCPRLARVRLQVAPNDARLLARLPPPHLDQLELFFDTMRSARSFAKGLRPFLKDVLHVRMTSGGGWTFSGRGTDVPA